MYESINFDKVELYHSKRKSNKPTDRVKSSSERLPYVMRTKRTDDKLKVLIQKTLNRFDVEVYTASGREVRKCSTYKKAVHTFTSI